MTSRGRAGSSRRGPALPDLVYPVRPGVDNEELRWSLRSVHTNAAGMFRKVWIVGTLLPTWLTNVEVIEASSVDGRAADVRAKMLAATIHPKVASRFVLLHDDYFLVDPITEWTAYHMGPMGEYVQRLSQLPRSLTVNNSSWLRTVVSTSQWMADNGHRNVLARQGHRPLLWSKTKLRKALDSYPADRPLDVVGLYDMAGAGGVGVRGVNSKITGDPNEFHAKAGKLNIPWLSSNDNSFAEGMIGGYIRGMFRTPSIYEV